MNYVAQRALAWFSVLIVVFALALGMTMGLAGEALAEDNDGPAPAGGCTYLSVTFLEGTVITQADGKKYECRAGKWERYSVKPNPGSSWNLPGTIPAQEMAPVS